MDQKSPIEESPKRILTKNEVLEVISRFIENSTFVRELSDKQGLYLFEIAVAGKKPGETIEYQYMRKGRFGRNQSSETSICAYYYQGNMPISGEIITIYKPETNEWKDVR